MQTTFQSVTIRDVSRKKTKLNPNLTTPSFDGGTRLGHQLWTVASTVGMTRSLGVKPILRHWEYRPYFSFPGELWPEERRTTFSDSGVIVPDEDMVNYRLWEDIADEVFEWVQPSANTKAALANVIDGLDGVVGIHVRRGLDSLPVSFYKAAMKRFPGDQEFVVFSDDMDWCHEHLLPLSENVYFVSGSQQRPTDNDYHTVGPVDYVDLVLMSECKAGSIISNSTYGWWGAFASGNEHVYYPRSARQGKAFPPHWSELPTTGDS